jgi:general secretion pathway protein G
MPPGTSATAARSVRQRRRSRGAFTLVEIMVVVIILAILAATIIPQFSGTTEEAKVSAAKHDIATLENCLERFFLNLGRYPTSEEGLRVLVTPPADGEKKWRGPYIKELRPDPWGHAYAYRSPGTHGVAKTYDLWSRGADGADGGEGVNSDITNWTE